MQEMQETQVPSLGQEDLLEDGVASHPWRIPRTEEPGGLQFMGLQKSQTRLHTENKQSFGMFEMGGFISTRVHCAIFSHS